MPVTATTLRERPLLVSLICVLGFVGAGVIFLGLLLPEVHEQIRGEYGDAFLLITSIGGLLSLVGLIGLWQMRRWGFYLYAAAIVLSMFIELNYRLNYRLNNPVDQIIGHIIPIVNILICIKYFKKMR